MKKITVTLPADLVNYIDYEQVGKESILSQAHGFLKGILNGFKGITRTDDQMTISLSNNSTEDEESVGIALNAFRTATGL